MYKIKWNGPRMLALIKLMFLFVLVFNPWANFPYKFVIIILVILSITYLEDKSFQKIGLKNQYSMIRLLGISLVLFVIVEPILDFLIQPLVNRLTGEIPDYTAFDIVKHDFSKFSMYLIFIWISAAIGEELLFRGFMFNQFNILFPEFSKKTLAIIILTSILFALPHLYQGLSGIILTFIFGLIFSVIYIKFNYNIWIIILLHGLVDSLFITLSYLDRLEYYEISNKLLFGY